MSKKRNDKIYDLKLIEALKKLPSQIEDKRHGFIIEIKDDRARSNETRFEHIAKKNHELKVRDIEAIPEGIIRYIKYVKSEEMENTFCYYIKRKGEDRGFIQVVILIDEDNPNAVQSKVITEESPDRQNMQKF